MCSVLCGQTQNLTAGVGYNHCPAELMLATHPDTKKRSTGSI